MAIVKLKKVTLCGLSDAKTQTLIDLQKMGVLHLIPMQTALSTESTECYQAEQVIEALKYLNQCPNKRHQMHSSDQFDLDVTTQEVLKVKSSIRSLSDQRDALKKRIEEIEPWGDFQLPDPKEVAGLKLWFYIVPKRLITEIADNLIWQCVYQNNQFAYVVVVAETEPQNSAMPVARTHTGSISLSQLRHQLNEITLALEDRQAERESLTRWIAVMILHLNEATDSSELALAERMALYESGVFAIQGWLPEKDLERLKAFADQRQLAILIEEPSSVDKPPTLLENRAELAGGEEVVNFYQTPAYQGWDPSVAVFISFTLFFAMILSDAGYAAVFGLILLLKWKTLGQTEKKKRLRFLAATTVSVALFWGVLTGGYMGYSPPSESFLGGIKIFDINDFDQMMALSMGVGVIHISMANLILAYQHKQSSSAFGSVGWVLIVCAGFGSWFLSRYDNQSLIDTCYGVMGAGFVMLILFSSEKPFDSWKNFGGRLLDGLKNTVRITQLFGDVLSYMRLFALGLASASLALTFNQLAVQVYHAMPGLGLLFSIIILLFGHGLNLVLCLMSGVVHGLRLNFIEFYNWSVSDEGYPFKAFAKKGGH